MKRLLLLVLIIFSSCAKQPESVQPPSMLKTLQGYIDVSEKFPIRIYYMDFTLVSGDKILVDSTTNKEVSINSPFLVVNKKNCDIRKVWGLRRKYSQSITNDLEISFTK